MKIVLFFFFCFPFFCFASFPVQEDFYSIDTVIINGNMYVDLGVDSLSKYPLEKESLADYRERLKKQNIINSQNTIKTPITFWQIVLVIGIIFLIFFILLMVSWVNSFEDY